MSLKLQRETLHRLDATPSKPAGKGGGFSCNCLGGLLGPSSDCLRR